MVIVPRTGNPVLMQKDSIAVLLRQIHLTNMRAPEFVKLVDNAFRDVNIHWQPNLPTSRHSSVDVWEAIELSNKHPRVNILKPGSGVAGIALPSIPCF